MPGTDNSIMLTKLHRPRSASDVILRQRLCTLLDQGLGLPLNLISAPAGFGKSTAVSQWVTGLDEKWNCGWYSADDSDNDLRSFLLYLVSAVRQAVPDSCADTLALVRLDTLPASADLVVSFCNDLVKLGDRVVIVIDDFHHLQEPAISEFLVAILEHPPTNFHLVIATRRDPAISLNRWRTGGSVNEVRLDNLRFSESEIESYLAGNLGANPPVALTKLAIDKIEGWPVALRLLDLSLRGTGSAEEIIKELPSIPARVSGYLIEGILDDIAPAHLEALLKTSILDRFCAGLVEAVVPGLDATEFLQWLVESNLFVINLDDSGQWFRYHHLFQEALQEQLAKRGGEKAVKDAHLRASEWFSGERFHDKAVDHALSAGADTRAGEIAARCFRSAETETDYFHHNRWMERLPAEVRRQNPTLMVESAWIKIREGANGGQDDMRQAEELMRNATLEPEEEAWLLGNLACLECTDSYKVRDFEKTIEAAERVLDVIPLEHSSLRGTSYLMESLAHRSRGDAVKAQRRIKQGFAEFSDDPNGLVYLYSADVHGYLMAGDMPGLRSRSRQYFEHCEKHHLQGAGGLARVLAGLAHYQLNELREAEGILSCSLAELEQMAPRQALWRRGYLLLSYAAEGRWDEAENLADSVLDELRGRSSAFMSSLIEGLRAELALRQGRVSQAIAWVKQCEPPKATAAIPNLSHAAPYARALLAQNTVESRETAGEFLGRIVADADLVHYSESRIQYRILQALWHRGDGREDEALEVLGEAVRIALPGGALRFFADIGEELIPLLHRLELDVEGAEYVGRIVQAMKTTPDSPPDRDPTRVPPPNPDLLIDALSKREYEILLLISQRLSNNELAGKLFISVGTVKRHLSNIYEKLGVHGRKEAVAKAVGLGLLK